MEPMKIEKINDLFKCKLCKKSYTNPILLPCGNVICLKDLDLICTDGLKVNCSLCEKEHQKPSDGFSIIKPLAEMMELRADRLNFGKNFEYGKNLLNSLDKILKQFSIISNHPKNFINEYFLELRKKCNVKREEIKTEVDNHFDQILKEIDKYQKGCETSSKIFDEISTEIEMYRNNLKDWIKEYDTTSINEETRNRIIFESKSAKLKLEEKMNAYKMNLLKNMTYRIEQLDVIDKKKFGYIVVEKVVIKNPENVLFNFTLENFIDFKKNPASVSLSNNVGLYKWFLRIYITDNCLSCYLKCNPDCLKDITLETEFSIQLIHSANPEKNTIRDFISNEESKKSFSSLSFSWGWPKFIPIQDVTNNGFYDSKNDSIQFECNIEIKSTEKSGALSLPQNSN